jgi:ABC-type sugar transport system substrate-binding protein
MRRSTALHALALAAAIVSGCGAAGASQSGGAAKQVSISFVYAAARGLNALDEMAMGAKAGAQDSPGVTFKEMAPPGPGMDGPAEVGLFQAAVKASKDGVAFVTFDPDLFLQPLQQAHSSGVPVVAVDTPPPPNTGVGTFVGNSNFEVGQMLATEMLDRIPAGATGQVVIGTTLPGLPVLDQRVTGMLQVLRQQRPGVQVIGPFNSHITPKANQDAWNAEVRQYPNALAYLAPSDLDAVSLAEIQRQTGRHLLVGACDLEEAALQAIKDGLVYTLVSPEHWLKGYLAIRLLAQRAQRGKALPSGWWNPGAMVVGEANVEEIIARQKDEASRSRWFQSRVEKQLANPTQYVKPLSAAL